MIMGREKAFYYPCIKSWKHIAIITNYKPR